MIISSKGTLINHNGLTLVSADNIPTETYLNLCHLFFTYGEGRGIYGGALQTDVPLKLKELAMSEKIEHYRVKGDDGDIFLFDEKKVETGVINYFLKEKDYNIVTQVLCFDPPPSCNGELPDAISNIENLREIPPTTFRSGCCVYFLCDKKEIVYIGKSINLHNRVANEHSRSKVFDRIYYLPVPHKKMDSTEKALILIFKPKYNSLKVVSASKSEIRKAEFLLKNGVFKG